MTTINATISPQKINATISEQEIIVKFLSSLPDSLVALTDTALVGVATGDLLSRGATYWNNLAVGIENQILSSIGGVPVWRSDAELENLTVNQDLEVGGVITFPGEMKIDFLNYGLNIADETYANTVGAKGIMIGRGTSVGGNRGTIALGYAAGATLSGAIAIGDRAYASGYYGVAIGMNPTATGYGSVAIGQQSNAIGSYSISIARYSSASGNSSIAMGYTAEATQQGNVAMGFASSATGSYSFALGVDSNSAHNYSMAFGRESTTTTNNQFILGSAAYPLDFYATGKLRLPESATPTAIPNYGTIYPKSDNKLYYQDGDGIEHEIAFV